jgi:hypothetical protein
VYHVIDPTATHYTRRPLATSQTTSNTRREKHSTSNSPPMQHACTPASYTTSSLREHDGDDG